MSESPAIVRALHSAAETLSPTAHLALSLMVVLGVPVRRKELAALLSRVDPNHEVDGLTELIKRQLVVPIGAYKQTPAWSIQPSLLQHADQTLPRDSHGRTALHSLVAAELFKIVEGRSEQRSADPDIPFADMSSQMLQRAVVHHLCAAGRAGEALDYATKRLDLRRLQQHAAYETLLSVGDDLAAIPGEDEKRGAVSALAQRIRGDVLIRLGRLKEAQRVVEESLALHEARQNMHGLAREYCILAGLDADLGRLEQSFVWSLLATEIGERENEPGIVRNALIWRGWVAHLSGKFGDASACFERAQDIDRRRISNLPYLTGTAGALHVQHLIGVGQINSAEEIGNFNLGRSRQIQNVEGVSLSLGQLGSMAVTQGDHEGGRKKLDEAVSLARKVDVRRVLIQTLIWRGAHVEDAQMTDLDEALELAEESQFLVLEADARIARAVASVRLQREEVYVHFEMMRAQKLCEWLGYTVGLNTLENQINKGDPMFAEEFELI